MNTTLNWNKWVLFSSGLLFAFLVTAVFQPLISQAASTRPSAELCHKFSTPLDRFELGFRGLGRRCPTEIEPSLNTSRR